MSVTTLLLIMFVPGTVHALGLCATTNKNIWAAVAMLESAIATGAFMVKMGWL